MRRLSIPTTNSADYEAVVKAIWTATHATVVNVQDGESVGLLKDCLRAIHDLTAALMEKHVVQT